jgi:hypothetical protein
MEIATKPLVMASEIAGLEPLRGLVKQNNKVVRVKFAYVTARRLQAAFVEREMSIGNRAALPPPSSAPPTPRSSDMEVAPSVGAVPQAAEAAPTVEIARLSPPSTLGESSQPPARRSAFKKSDAGSREWKPTD